jgi:hypothetical protein
MIVSIPNTAREAEAYAHQVAQLVSIAFPCDDIRVYYPEPHDFWWADLVVYSRSASMHPQKKVPLAVSLDRHDQVFFAAQIVDHVWPMLITLADVIEETTTQAGTE